MCGRSALPDQALDLADGVILAIFTVEVVIKMLGVGPRYLDYFKDSWNVFDFVIVAVALVVFGVLGERQRRHQRLSSMGYFPVV